MWKMSASVAEWLHTVLAWKVEGLGFESWFSQLSIVGMLWD